MKNDLRQTLKGLGLKSTPKRIAILEVLEKRNSYISPEEVWTELKGRLGRLGLPTVYRNLEEMAAGGLISKVVHPNRQLYYYWCRERVHHHHFVCLSCRKVEDLTFCGAREIEQEVRRRIRGKVLSHIIQVNGLCRTCSAPVRGAGRKGRN